MMVTEIFQSIQGEGPDVGKMAIFIRLHGCNLQCPWCDTKNSWEEGPYYEMSVGQVMEWVFRTPFIKHVVITGGEPFLQMEELIQLVKELREHGRHIAIETNGTIMPEDLTLFDLIVVSPKGLNTADDWFEPSLTHKNIELKFVIHSENIESITDWIRMKGLSGVYLMPIGTDVNQLIIGSHAIVNAMCEKHLDCILTPRLHSLIGVK